MTNEGYDKMQIIKHWQEVRCSNTTKIILLNNAFAYKISLW